MKKYYIPLITSLCFVMVTAQSQDFKSAVLELRKEFEKSDKIHLVMKIKAYENESAAKPFYAETGEVKRYGSKYLSRFGGQEMLMNEKYLVVVNNESKEIAVTERDIKSERELQESFTFTVDSLLSPMGAFGNAQFIGENSGVATYQISMTNGEIRRVNIIVDVLKKQLKKIQYFYDEGQFVTIDFEVFNIAPQFETSIFDEASYVQITDKKIQTAKKYSSYQLVNSFPEDEAN